VNGANCPMPTTRVATAHGPRDRKRHAAELIAQVPAVIVDRNSVAKRRLQPRQLRLIQNHIVAIGLRIIVRIAVQRRAYDVQAIVSLE
jgi:hypothetical protein